MYTGLDAVGVDQQVTLLFIILITYLFTAGTPRVWKSNQ